MASIPDWQTALSSQYGRHFSQEVAEIIRAAVSPSMVRVNVANKIREIHTMDFLPHFAKRTAVLRGVRFPNVVGSAIGKLPWKENVLADAENGAISGLMEDARFSVDVDRCLKLAASFVDSEGSNNEVTSWHFVGALLSSGSKSILWLLEKNKSSPEEVIAHMLSNMQEHEPELFQGIDWDKLLDIKVGHDESPDKSGIDRTFLLDHLTKQWAQFKKSERWSKAILLAFDRLHELQKHLISEAPTYIGNDTHIALSRVSVSITSNASILALLSLAAQQKSGNRHIEKEVNMDWAERMVGYLKLTSKGLGSILLREIKQHKNVSQKFPKSLKLITTSLQEDVNGARNLADKISNGVIDVRHLVAACLSRSRGRGKFDAEGIPSPLMIEVLEDHVENDIQVQQTDKVNGWNSVIRAIRESGVDPEVDVLPSDTALSKDDLKEVENQEDAAKGDSDTAKNQRSSEEQQRGKGGSYHRESESQKLGDNVKSYARAIGRVFRNAGGGDFCFAVFGRWGRGKTTLIKEVGENLKNNFAQISFNAWKYPRRPEVWVYLYETFKRKAEGDRFWNKMQIGLQSNLLKDKGIPLVWPCLLLVFSAYPKADITQTLVFSGIPMIVAILLMALYFLRLWRGFGIAMMRYCKIPSHAQHLGLQAAIGEDLKRLIQVWVKKGTSKDNRDSEEPKRLARIRRKWDYVIGRICCYKGFFTAAAFVFTSIGLVGCSISQLVGHTPCWLWGVILLAIASVFIITVAVFKLPKQTDYILLVVDDLDRCPSKEMLVVIESIRVFLDDEEIRPYLRVVMLLDRNILSHAIVENHKGYLNDEDGVHDRKSLIEEQIDKYFLLSLNLPDLNSRQVWDIGATIVGADSSAQRAAEGLKTFNENLPEAMDLINQANEFVGGKLDEGVKSFERNTARLRGLEEKYEKRAQGERDLEGKVEETEEEYFEGDRNQDVSEILFEHEKIGLLKLFDSWNKDSSISPRRMRSLMMQFFLTREIADELQYSFTSDQILKGLSPGDKRVDDEDLAQVLEMITGQSMGESAPEETTPLPNVS